MGVKKFIKKSVAFVAAAAMALTMVVAPVGAGASTSYAEGTTSDSGLNLNKSVELQNDGTYKITLNAYATGEYTTVTEKSGVPLDIVLVLDQSGSMKNDVSSLRTAVTNFVTNISNNAKEYNVDHRIALVGYASRYDSNSKWANTGLFINGSLYNYQKAGSSTQTSRLTAQNYKDALVSVNNSDGSITNSITTAISNIGANGATYTNYGLEMANGVFENNPIASDSNRKRIVVVFTDGQPGQSEYESGIAGFAVNEAYKTKNTYGATVYSVGFYNSASTNVTNFMNYISSNYPGAQAELEEHEDGFWGTYYTASFTPGDKTGTKYYMQATNQTELSKIFTNISKDIETPSTSVKLDANAVTRDIITDKLDISDNTKVTAYTEDYKGSDTWEKSATQVALTTSIDTPTKAVDVTGFDYAANFVDKTKAKGQRLVVEITGLTATQAGDSMITNVTDKSGVYATKDTENPSEVFNKCSISIPSKSYVLDYGKTVSTAAADYGLSAVSIANTGKPSPYGVKLTGEYGTFAINNNGDLDYTPGKINWDGIDTGYVFGQKSDSTDYKWEEVNFMPANSVYYEDDFASTATVQNGDTGTKIIYDGSWTVDGTAQDPEKQSSDNTVQHGWDSTYADDKNYSNGTAHKGTTGATATFKFTGTGVDIYSKTDLTTGKVIATLTNNGENVASKFMIVDNKAASGTYYQVPTLFFDGLDYGTYEVKIQVLDPVQDGNTSRGTYYLDGIRVYNPLGVATSEKVTNAYNVAGESNAIFASVRNMLLDAKTFDGYTVTNGAVFIDQLNANDKESSGEATTETIGTYKDLGAKNEVYLDADQAIAFKINTPYSGKVFIGAKSLNGQQVSMKVTDITATEKTKTVTLSHTSDMYYEINPTTEGYVVIQNTNTTKGAKLAITKLRLTGVATATTLSINLESSPAVMNYVNQFSTLSSAKTDDKGMVVEQDKADVDVENPDEDNEDNNNQESKPDESNSNSIWNIIMNNLRKWFK